MEAVGNLRNHRHMTESAPATPTRRWAVYAGMVLITVLGSWPFLATLDFPPMGLDSVLWMTRGAPDQPGWIDWVFRTQHFSVGYRPVAGVSFTLTHAFAGTNPLPYRVTDLLIHVVNGWLVFGVARLLAPELSRWAALLAAAVFFLHPAGEEIVPWIERRSYSICTGLSLLGLWAALKAARAPAGPPPLLTATAALCFGLSLVSNEMAVLAIAAAPALVFVSIPEGRDRLRNSARIALPVLGTVAAFFILRLWVIGEVGGYSPQGLEASRPGLVFAAYWRHLLAFCIEYPVKPGSLHPATALALLVGCAYLAWRAFQPLSRRPLEPASLLPAALATWLLGASFVLAAQRVWFPREVYPLLPPLGLLIGIVAGDSFRSQLRPRALHLTPQLLLLVALLHDSPALRGQDPVRMQDWNEMRRMFEDVEARTPELEPPALVLLALPYNQDATRRNPLSARPLRPGPPRSTRLAATWLNERFEGREVEFIHALSYPEGFEWSSGVAFRRLDEGPALVFPADKDFSVRADWRNSVELPGGETAVWLDPFPQPGGRQRYLYLRSAGRDELIRLTGTSP